MLEKELFAGELSQDVMVWMRWSGTISCDMDEEIKVP